MRTLFDKLCIPLMLINHNVYTFISGVLLSFATGNITTLCLEKIGLAAGWHLYISSVFHCVAGALAIYIATKISNFQIYISANDIYKRDEQKAVFTDHLSEESTIWVISFLTFILSTVLGFVFLFLNFCI